jgi:hypothetical protein
LLSCSAIGCMISFFLEPLRKKTNCHCKNWSGCPANDGVFSVCETPASPWHGVHCAAFSLTTSSAALAGPAIEASIAAAGKKQQKHITAVVLNGIFIADLLQKKRSPCLMSKWKNFENKTNRSKSVRAT